MRTHRRDIIRPTILLAAGALALAGCGGSAVAADDVETQISEQLTEVVGQAPDEVACEDDLPAEVDAEITCVLTAEGTSYDVVATVTSVEDGRVDFDIEVADEPRA